MIIENRLKQHFNGFLVFMRITFFALGILLIINQRWLTSGIFLTCALLTFFTVSGTAVDLNFRRIKSYYLIFGVFKTGKWQSLENYKSLIIIPISNGNPVMNFFEKKHLKEVDEYRIILLSKTKKEAVPLKSCKTPEAAQTSIDEFSNWLKVPVSPVKIL